MSDSPLPDDEREKMRGKLLAYAGTDLLCYWAEEKPLQARQQAQWEPVLAAIETHYGVHFERAQGIMPVQQPQETLQRLKSHIDGYDDETLWIMARLVPLSGSLLLVLALEIGVITPEKLVELAHLDENFQAESWGVDPEAKLVRDQKETLMMDLATQIAGILGKC